MMHSFITYSFSIYSAFSQHSALIQHRVCSIYYFYLLSNNNKLIFYPNKIVASPKLNYERYIYGGRNKTHTLTMWTIRVEEHADDNVLVGVWSREQHTLQVVRRACSTAAYLPALQSPVIGQTRKQGARRAFSFLLANHGEVLQDSGPTKEKLVL